MFVICVGLYYIKIRLPFEQGEQMFMIVLLMARQLPLLTYIPNRITMRNRLITAFSFSQLPFAKADL
jgi:hypothetical protein